MKTKKFSPRTEHVSLGREALGTIRVTTRGHEVYGPDDGYVCTAVSIEHARRLLFERHKEQTAAEKALAEGAT